MNPPRLELHVHNARATVTVSNDLVWMNVGSPDGSSLTVFFANAAAAKDAAEALLGAAEKAARVETAKAEQIGVQ